MEQNKQGKKMTVEDLENEMESLVGELYDNKSFYNFLNFAQRVQQLARIACHNGVIATERVARAFFLTIDKRYTTARDKELRQQREYLQDMVERAYETGDEEFDAFRHLIRYHDWTYDYSDDIQAFRRGNESYKKILAIVKEKGGIYETTWRHACKLNKMNSGLD